MSLIPGDVLKSNRISPDFGKSKGFFIEKEKAARPRVERQTPPMFSHWKSTPTSDHRTTDSLVDDEEG
jgi:hypothetical protein